MNTNHVEQAITLLQNTQKQVYELLQPFSGLYLQADHLLTALINGLIFTTQQTNLNGTESNFDPKPLVFTEDAQPLPATITSVQTVEIEHEQVDKLRQKATELYSNFYKRESKDIVEACNALEIRAVAKLAGIDPMDHPEQIDTSFIQTIKEAITKKETEQKAMEDWLAKQEETETETETKQEAVKETTTVQIASPAAKQNKILQPAKKATLKK